MDWLADVWPVFGLLIQTPRLQLRLPRQDDLCELTRAARVIAAPGEPQLHLPWMYRPSPDTERQFLQRYWRALAHWKPGSWHLPLAIYLDAKPVGIQDIWASDFARTRSAGTRILDHPQPAGPRIRAVRGLSRLGQTGGHRDLIGLYLCCDWSIPSPELGPGTPADVVTRGETCW